MGDFYYAQLDGYLIVEAERQTYKTKPCSQIPSNRLQGAYAGQYQMATASPGQTLTIGWVSNNHQNSNGQCQGGTAAPNPNAPVKIYQSSTSDPTVALNDPPTFSLNYDNCFPQYNKEITAGSPDISRQHCLCTGQITMPTTPGTYTYVWSWAIATSNPYTSCFDVEVGGATGNPAPTPPPPSPPAPTPPESTTLCDLYGIQFCAGRNRGEECVRRGGQMFCVESTGSGNTGTTGNTGGAGNTGGCSSQAVALCLRVGFPSCIIYNGLELCSGGGSNSFFTVEDDGSTGSIDIGGTTSAPGGSGGSWNTQRLGSVSNAFGNSPILLSLASMFFVIGHGAL